ncbi:MAG: hypothetical protein ABH886_04015, partial [Candidatus Desantisbacteria bacterium]
YFSTAETQSRREETLSEAYKILCDSASLRFIMRITAYRQLRVDETVGLKPSNRWKAEAFRYI